MTGFHFSKLKFGMTLDAGQQKVIFLAQCLGVQLLEPPLSNVTVVHCHRVLLGLGQHRLKRI